MKFIHFHWRKCIWKCRLEKGGHLVSASMLRRNQVYYQYPQMTPHEPNRPDTPIKSYEIKSNWWLWYIGDQEEVMWHFIVIIFLILCSVSLLCKIIPIQVWVGARNQCRFHWNGPGSAISKQQGGLGGWWRLTGSSMASGLKWTLTYLPLVPHICVSELGQHWFR